MLSRSYIRFVGLAVCAVIAYNLFTASNSIQYVAPQLAESAKNQAAQLSNYANTFASGTTAPPAAAKEAEYRRENATFITLARNNELDQLLPSIRTVEDRFNGKYHYDWVFLNNEPFSDEFINMTSTLISGNVHYGVVPQRHWSYPSFINQTHAAETRDAMAALGIIYAESESYRHMCRFESGFFFQHELMQRYRYYWRVEPGTSLHCDINYDVFRYFRQTGKKYGFTITVHEFGETIETLWETTKSFIAKFPKAVHPNNLAGFVTVAETYETYNLCHFWSNFEVGDMDFWRGETYTNYFEHLDKAGGFFYERWGDAPVHSIAASLFMDRNDIHFFDDIGYTHPPMTHCPYNQKEKGLKCDCVPENTIDWESYACTRLYCAIQGIPIPPQIVAQDKEQEEKESLQRAEEEKQQELLSKTLDEIRRLRIAEEISLAQQQSADDSEEGSDQISAEFLNVEDVATEGLEEEQEVLEYEE